jgi:hypothetical protein
VNDVGMEAHFKVLSLYLPEGTKENYEYNVSQDNDLRAVI